MSTPCSIITLFKVPALTPTYRDSYYFKNVTAQTAFFDGNSVTHKTLNPSQVTRVSNNQVKLPYPCEEILQYNYMRIRNQRWGEDSSPTGKEFYCFIMNVEYVSDMCCLVTFKVDVIQSFLIQSTIREAFVERCHADDDGLFKNREIEKFSVSNYTVDVETDEPFTFYIVIGIASGTQIEYQVGVTYTTEPSVYQLGTGSTPVYSEAEYFIYDPNNSTQLDNLKHLLVDLHGRMDAVTDFFCVPVQCYWGATGGKISKNHTYGTSSTWDISNLAPTGSNIDYLSGYLPKNKKMYNYPYTFCRVANNLGASIDLMWEEFPHNPTSFYEFRIFGSWFGGGSASLYPYQYEGTYQQPNKNYCLSISDFPRCPFISDAYKEWLAQKSTSEVIKGGVASMGSILGASLASIIAPPLAPVMAIGAVTTTSREVGNGVADAIEASKQPNIIQNNGSNPSVPLANGWFGYTAFRMSLSKSEAEQIDNYFTMFGYAQNKVMNVRDYMNGSKRAKFFYIKTKGMNVQGNYPAVYRQELDDIFDNGITFWKTSADVGDYSNNTIVNPT